MTHALAQIQVLHRIPVIHGVFVFDKVKHAKVRCLGKKHNRGTEAAQTALEMARIMKQIGRDPLSGAGLVKNFTNRLPPARR